MRLVLRPDRLRVMVRDVEFRGVDHLIGDLNRFERHRTMRRSRRRDVHLDEQRRHAFRRVVVSRDRIDHSNGVDQAGNRLFHADRIRIVQRFAKAFQRVQIPNVVFRFVRRIGDASVENFPLLKTNRNSNADEKGVERT